MAIIEGTKWVWYRPSTWGKADWLYGTDGNDTIYGHGGNDRIFAYGGNDSIEGGTGDDVAHGGAGNDTFAGDYGTDVFYGEDGNDYIRGGFQDDKLIGGSGNDTLLGDWGQDTLEGEEGNDSLNGGLFSDRLSGGDGNDTLVGDADAGSTSPAHDTLDGGSGDDVLLGGAGLDYLIGGMGADTLWGADPDSTTDDEFVYVSVEDSGPTYGFDKIYDFSVPGRDLSDPGSLKIYEDRIDLRAIDARPDVAGDQAFEFVTPDQQRWGAVWAFNHPWDNATMVQGWIAPPPGETDGKWFQFWIFDGAAVNAGMYLGDVDIIL